MNSPGGDVTEDEVEIPTVPFYKSPIALLVILIIIPNLAMLIGHKVYIMLVKWSPDHYFNRCRDYISRKAFDRMLARSSVIFNISLKKENINVVIIVCAALLWLKLYRKNLFYSNKAVILIQIAIAVLTFLAIQEYISVVPASPLPFASLIPWIGYLSAFYVCFKYCKRRNAITLSFLFIMFFHIILDLLFVIPSNFKVRLFNSMKLNSVRGPNVEYFKENLRMFCDKYNFPIDHILFGMRFSKRNLSSIVFNTSYINLSSSIVKDCGADGGIGIFLHELKHILEKGSWKRLACLVCAFIVQILPFLIFRRKGLTSVAFIENLLLLLGGKYASDSILYSVLFPTLFYRRAERACDKFACDNGYAYGLLRAFTLMAEKDYIPIYCFDSPWYVNMFGTHPTLLERMKFFKKYIEV